VIDQQTSSEAETEALGEALGRRFQGGEVVLLEGELGSGKTAFVRGLARGLGGDVQEVASPTFVILTSYPGRLTLHHADLYRLERVADLSEVGLEELPGPRGVLAVEWAERLGGSAWSSAFRVRIGHTGGDSRRVVIEGGEA
jgi:tRNA threonylcarbamoyladenosine biosynthesis protein TsaE